MMIKKKQVPKPGIVREGENQKMSGDPLMTRLHFFGRVSRSGCRRQVTTSAPSPARHEAAVPFDTIPFDAITTLGPSARWVTGQAFAMTLVLGVLFGDLSSIARGDDWPMWRHDAGRTAVSQAKLPSQPREQWTRSLGAPQPAWPLEQDYHGKLEYDRSYSPIVLGKRVIVPSMVSDRVTAFHTETGEELWRFYAEGPVRFAPVGWEDRVYFVSDDGHLYCLGAEDGGLLWKVRGGPADRKLLGNERLISTYPARGAPVLVDETIYFAAGIWPFLGTFLHAVDARSGELLWTNSGTGAIYNLHQHGGADAFGGVAPQGYLAAQQDYLIVAGGLTVPAVFHRRTGEFLHFEQSHAAVGKGTGGYRVATHRDWYFNSGKMYSLEDGKLLLSVTTPLLGTDEIVCLHEGRLVAFASELDVEEATVTDRRGRETTHRRYSLRDLHQAKLPIPMDQLHFQAGEQLVGTSKEGEIVAITWPRATRVGPDTYTNESGEVDEDSLPTAKLLWKQSIPGTVWSLLAADDRLFVVTDEGDLICLGSEATEPRHWSEEPVPFAARGDAEPGDESASDPSASADSHDWEGVVAALAPTIPAESPWGLVWGLETGELVEQLLAQTDLRLAIFDSDEQRVASLRRRLDDAGLYGRRAHLVVGDPTTYTLSPYWASLIMSERLPNGGRRPGTSSTDGGQEAGAQAAARSTSPVSTEYLTRLLAPLRPYGGVAWFPIPSANQDSWLAKLEEAQSDGVDQLDGVEKRDSLADVPGEWLALGRPDGLPGAGQWTQQYGNSANTVFSEDTRVKAPLGMLWFGGPSNRYALPRHAQGPIPQVVRGRLIIEGVDTLSARCVYTGNTLWIREFPDIGFPYKAKNHTFTGTVYINNQPGANFIGSNYASTPDSIYVVHEDTCHRLAIDSGDTLNEIRLPAGPESNEPESWGFLTIWGDYLVAGADPHIFDDRRIGEDNWNKTSSRRVVVMDRFSGEVLWSIEGEYGFRHNAILPADKRLFLIDRLSEEALKLQERRGEDREETFRLLALDLDSGEPLWTTTDNVFGTWLSYSTEHDIVLQAGRTGGRAHLSDEPSERIVALRGSTGEVVWDKPIRYTGPLVIHGDQILSSRSGHGSFSLLTGEPRVHLHPLTGSEIPWTHKRTYGCGTVLACENLLTFRSGAAGFHDMREGGGTGNFGGFRAGCTPNLIPADGVLNAPDYTRTCSCSYQNQTSLALVHQPDVEIWTYSTLSSPATSDVVRRVGINLGAPGDRMADDGTLWMEFPSVAGSSPDIPVRARGEAIRWFRHHSSLLDTPDEESSLVSTSGTGAQDGTGTQNSDASHDGSGAPAPWNWVAASGLEGAVTLDLTLLGEPDEVERQYTVRLFFAEMDAELAEERRFDVYLQGNRVLENFHIAEAAGGMKRAVAREFAGIPVTGRLRIELRPVDSAGAPPKLSGIEAVLEE
jgi:outer membrane protein assembly factor BamB